MLGAQLIAEMIVSLSRPDSDMRFMRIRSRKPRYLLGGSAGLRKYAVQLLQAT